MSRINQSTRHHLDSAARTSTIAALSVVGAGVAMVGALIAILCGGIGALMLQVNPAAMVDRPVLLFIARLLFGS